MMDKNNSDLEKLTKSPLSIDEIHTLANNLELVESERKCSRNRSFGESVAIGIATAAFIGTAALTGNFFIGIGVGIVVAVILGRIL